MMLAWSLLGKAVIVCDADRVSAAKWASEGLKSDVLILDDGFQHRRVARDLDIVTIDAMNPFGNGRLLPAGILREPVESLSRADCLVITRVSEKTAPELIDRIRKVTTAPILQSRTVIRQIRSLGLTDGAHETEQLNQPLAAFCAIGNAQAFFDQLREAAFEVTHQTAFRDHHNYSQSDVDRLTQQATTNGAQALITTAKDAVKLRSLRFDLPCYVAEIEVEISESATFLALIEQAIIKKTS
ncbi:MAG TPA: tetraacyldisaccharide 4'-kinase, partial [Pyrinomonadaceae bacterium]